MSWYRFLAEVMLQLPLQHKKSLTTLQENCYLWLEIAQPGAISHARWLTEANRILRLNASPK